MQRWCRGAGTAEEEVQKWCRGGVQYADVVCRGGAGEGAGAEVVQVKLQAQRCRGACRSEDMLSRCRGSAPAEN
jgi:hypothetical protein